MKSPHPVVATWLLQRFIGPDKESFIGDLREQYSEGRSRFWYWRQTLTAIAVGTFTAIANDKSLPIRAIFGGVLTKFWFAFPVRFVASVFVPLPAHVPITTLAAWRPDAGVVPCIILAISGVGAARSLLSKPPLIGSSGTAGPMTLCWAGAWLAWTIIIARFSDADWSGVQALTQTACIIIGGLLVPMGPRADDHKLTTLGLS